MTAAAMIVPALSPWMYLLIAVLVATEAVIAAVMLAAFARNKVEGLALTKLMNIAAVTALIAAIPSPMRYIGGLIPTYWIGELLHLTDVAPMNDWIAAVLALGIHALLVAVLLMTFAKRAG